MSGPAYRLAVTLACLFMTWQSMAQPSVTHTVQRKETAYGIAKAYGVDLNRLLDLNPWAEGGIRKGDVLRIPAQSVATDEIDAPTWPDDARERGDLPREEGGGLERDGVPVGAGMGALGDTVEGVPLGRPVPPTWSLDTLRIAVFLPFYSYRDSLGRQERRLREIATDCAAGIRLALDSGRQMGAHCEVRFLDTGRDTSGQLNCGPRDLVGWGGPVHLAMGPLKRSQFRDVRNWPGMENAVHVALTDLGESLLHGAQGILMPYVSVGQRMKGLAKHVSRMHRGEQVLLLATGDIRNLEAETAFREAWQRLADEDSLLLMQEVEVSSKGLGALRGSLSDVRRNVLVVPGGKANRSLAGVLQTEMQLGDSLDFVLYADEAWRTFEFLDPEMRERIGFTVVDAGGSLPDSSVFGALDSAHFCLARRMADLRSGDAGAYGWMAHDVMRSALGWTAAYGTGWPGRLGAGERLIRPVPEATDGLYRFFWTSSGQADSGLVNGAIRILRQEDFQWLEVGRESVPGRDEDKSAP